MLASKDGMMPFVLKFFEHTGKYQLIERYCGHAECHAEENLVHYFIDPANLGLVAWAPGSTFVHTQTENYKKGVSGDYCNLQLRDVEGLEELMEHMKAKGIMPQKVTK